MQNMALELKSSFQIEHLNYVVIKIFPGAEARGEKKERRSKSDQLTSLGSVVVGIPVMRSIDPDC